MAWAFSIGKKKGVNGEELEVPWHDYTSLLISRPKMFGFELKPRTKEKEALVRENWRRLSEQRTGAGGEKTLQPQKGDTRLEDKLKMHLPIEVR